MFNNIHKLLVIKKYKIFIASIVISFFFICLRNFKLYPSVFTDEQFHSYFARLVDFKNLIRIQILDDILMCQIDSK